MMEISFASMLSRLALALALVLALGGAGCGASNAPSRQPSQTAKSAPKSTSKPKGSTARKEKREVVKPPKGKSWVGWRWKGTRDDCFFLVGSRCFDKKEAACKAAKCSPGTCATDDGAPATVSCSN